MAGYLKLFSIFCPRALNVHLEVRKDLAHYWPLRFLAAHGMTKYDE
jgi:hypothetical protein